MSEGIHLPEQTYGDTYELALNAHAELVDPQADAFWEEQDVEPLATGILGRMLLGVQTSLDGYEYPYEVLLETRLGHVVGEGAGWAQALARALAAYAELRQRARLVVEPLSRKDAYAFIDRVHRHHKPPVADKFRLGAYAVVNDQHTLVGVVVVGRPVSRLLQEQGAWEVTRLAVLEGGQNLCSKLYAAAWKEARQRGCCWLVTYILADEPATSLKAAGWQLEKEEAGGGSWSRRARPRQDKAPTTVKQRWGVKCRR